LTASSHHSLQDCDWLDRFCWMAELAGDVSSLSSVHRRPHSLGRHFREAHAFSLGSGFVSGLGGAESFSVIAFRFVRDLRRVNSLRLVVQGWEVFPLDRQNSLARGIRSFEVTEVRRLRRSSAVVRGSDSSLRFHWRTSGTATSRFTFSLGTTRTLRFLCMQFAGRPHFGTFHFQLHLLGWNLGQ
jgi:hypothetical protein